MADVGYFDSVSANLKTGVGAQVKGIAEGAKSNSEVGVSESVNALDTGVKAARPSHRCGHSSRDNTAVPMPQPYVGVLLRPQDFIAAAISSFIPPSDSGADGRHRQREAGAHGTDDGRGNAEGFIIL